MNNLLLAGLNLRTLEIKDLHELIEDLNYNFIQILQLPGFKGQPGEDGASITGPAGTRGNLWIFAMSDTFIANYPSITAANQVDLAFLNGQLSTDLPLLLSSLDITDLVDNDVVVLPSRDVIQFNSTTGLFEETGIRFADGLSLTEQDVINIVNNILNGLGNNDIWTLYTGIAKNHSDLSGGVNIEENFNSVIDVPVSGAGPGVQTSVFKVNSIKEALTTNDDQIMQLTGAPQIYHELVQRTQNDLTNDYLPGVDDYAALAVMQNSYHNGIVMGHRLAATMNEWARIYRTENVLRLVSNYHPVLEETGRIDISLQRIQTFSENMENVADTYRLIDRVSQEDIITANATTVVIGNDDTVVDTELHADNIKMYSDQITNANHHLLGSYGNLVRPSDFQPQSTVVVNDSSLLVTHNLLYDFMQDVAQDIQDIWDAIQDLLNKRFFREVEFVVGAFNPNVMYEFGTYAGRVGTDPLINITGITGAPFLIADLPLGAQVILNVFKAQQDDTPTALHYGYQELSVVSSDDSHMFTYRRSALSPSGGGSVNFGFWNRVLESEMTGFVPGQGMHVNSTTFGTNDSILISHQNSPVGILGEPVENHEVYNVLQRLLMDPMGHPISAQTLDLRYYFYTKAEVDDLLDNLDFSVTTLSGFGETNNRTDGQYAFNDYTVNWLDVYHPSGKNGGDVIGVIPSIHFLSFGGDVNGDDFTWCKYQIQANKIRFIAQNSENDGTSWINYLIIYR